MGVKRQEKEFLLDLGSSPEPSVKQPAKIGLWLGYVLPLVVLLALMVFISSQHRMPSLGFDLSYLHIVEYFILSVTFLRLFSYLKAPAPYIMAILFTILVGGFDEVYQGFVPGRTKSIIDFFFDIGGALLVFVLKLLRRFAFFDKFFE